MAYIVAEGDTTWGIENRFGITHDGPTDGPPTHGIAGKYNRSPQPGERLSLVDLP